MTLISSPQKSINIVDASCSDLVLQSPVDLTIEQQNQILASMQNAEQQRQQQQSTVMLQNIQTENLIQQSQLQATTAALQGFQPGVSSSLILTPTVMSHVQPTATLQTVNLTDGTFTNIQAQPATGAFQGIQPGESSSLILTPTVMSQVQPTATLQTINLTDGIQTITLNQEQLGLSTSSVQIPLSTTIFPSSITIDPNLLKKPNSNLNSSVLAAQNFQINQSPVVNNHQLSTSPIIVDGNLINALTSNNLHSVTNQVLLSDMIAANQQGLITMPLSQSVNKISNQVQLMPVGVAKQQKSQTVKKLTNQQARSLSLASGLATPQKTIKVAKVSAVTSVKKKGIQSIQNFSPDSSIFKESKKTKDSATPTLSSSNSVTIKKINVIKKSNVIPVKPTSVEQVQPGVFKLQLKKVSSAEATALLSNKSISSKGGKVEHSLTSLINTSTGGPVTDLKNIGRSAMQMSRGKRMVLSSNRGSNPNSFYGGTQNTVKTPAQALFAKTLIVKDSKKVGVSGGNIDGVTVKVSNLPKSVVNKIQDIGKYNVLKILSSPSAPIPSSTFANDNIITTRTKTITPTKTLKSVAAVPKTAVLTTAKSILAKPSTFNPKSPTQISPLSTPSTSGFLAQNVPPPTISTSTSTKSSSTTTTVPKNTTKHTALPTPRRVSIPTVSPSFLRATLEAKKAANAASPKPLSSSSSKPSPMVGKDPSKIVSKLVSAKNVIPIVKTTKSKENQSLSAASDALLSLSSAATGHIVTNKTKLKPKVIVTKVSTSATSANTTKVNTTNASDGQNSTSQSTITTNHSTKKPGNINTTITKEDSLECQERGFLSPVGCTENKNSNATTAATFTTANIPKIDIDAALKALPKIPMKSSSSLDQANVILQKAKLTASSSSQRSRRPQGRSDSTAVQSHGMKKSQSLFLREQEEVDSIREAIESSRVGQPAEINMRELAKLEITKQVRRCSAAASTAASTAVSTSKKKSSTSSSSSTANNNNNSRKQSTTVTTVTTSSSDDSNNTARTTLEERKTTSELKRKIDDTRSNKDNNTQQLVASSSSEKKPKTDHPTPVKQNHTPSATAHRHKTRRHKNKSSPLILDESRKRERPKKFDDFVLAPEKQQQHQPPQSKKEKKAKKFFFPKQENEEIKNQEIEGDNAANKGTTTTNNSSRQTSGGLSCGSSNSMKTETETDSESENGSNSINMLSDEKPEPSQHNSSTTVNNADNNDDDDSDADSKTTTTVTSSNENSSLSAKTLTKTNVATDTNTNTSMITTTTTTKPSTTKKQNNSKKKKKKKKKPAPAICVELEPLPEHLKKAKAASSSSARKLEDTVIDVTKVKLRSSFTETSFVLSEDSVEPRTFKLINRKNWVCTLCGRPGNLGTLDVLFGPYKIGVGALTTTTKTANITADGNNKENLSRMNVWLHRDCAVWTSNICLANQTLRGLGESLNEAALTVSFCIVFYHKFLKFQNNFMGLLKKLNYSRV